MRGLKSTLALAVILIGLVGYIYYLNTRESEGDDARERAFAEVNAEEIEEIQIKSADGETSRAQKVDGAWKLVEPVDAAADESELTSITSSLASLDIQRVVEENAADLTQYGLEPARIEVGFRTKGSTETRQILFGERTPTGGDLYARLPDQRRVFLVSSFLDSTFNKSAFALREKNVVTFDRDKVDRVEIAAGDRRIALTKSGTEWRLVEPFAARADFAAVEGALERLSSAQMQAIVEAEGGDLKTFRLDPPIASFSAIAGDARGTLLLGETENAVIYAKDASRPMVFTVAPTLYTDLIRETADFRRKDLFDSRSFTANRIELRRGADTIVLEKAKGADGADTWRLASGGEVDKAAAEDLLTKITGLRAESFEATANPALQTPVLTVVVQFDDKRTEQVTFARSGTEVVAARADEPGSATVEAAAFNEAMEAAGQIQGSQK